MKKMFMICAIVLLAGCTPKVAKVMQATGGSKADGTVELSYSYGYWGDPGADTEAALITAKQRCASWGYNSAEPFGGQVEKCQTRYDKWGNCKGETLVTVTYQCIDLPSNPPK